MAKGIGSIDLHLLASTCLTTQVKLWIKDKRLVAVAHQLDITYITV